MGGFRFSGVTSSGQDSNKDTDQTNPKYPERISGYFSNEDNEVDVSIRYCEYEGETCIYNISIAEYNYIIVMMPNVEAEPVYMDIAGIAVLRHVSRLGYLDPIEGFAFGWNQDGMTYSVDVYNISEEEGIKIVESMIDYTAGIEL